MDGFRKKSPDSPTGRRNYPSSIQRSGGWDVDWGCGKTSSHPCSAYRNLNPHLHYPVIQRGSAFPSSLGEGVSSLYFQSFSLGKTWKKCNMKTFWNEWISSALLPFLFQLHFNHQVFSAFYFIFSVSWKRKQKWHSIKENKLL